MSTSPRKKNIIRKLIDLPDAHVYYGTESLAGWVQDLFLSEQVDEVFVAYTRFHNVLSYEPCVEAPACPDKRGAGRIQQPEI